MIPELNRRRFLKVCTGAALAVCAGCSPEDRQSIPPRDFPDQYTESLEKIRTVTSFGSVDQGLMNDLDSLRKLTTDLLVNPKTLHFQNGPQFRAYYPFINRGFHCVASFESGTNGLDEVRASFIDSMIINMITLRPNNLDRTQLQRLPKNYILKSKTLTAGDLEMFHPRVDAQIEGIHPLAISLMGQLFEGGKYDAGMAEKIREYYRLPVFQFKEVPYSV